MVQPCSRLILIILSAALTGCEYQETPEVDSSESSAASVPPPPPPASSRPSDVNQAAHAPATRETPSTEDHSASAVPTAPPSTPTSVRSIQLSTGVALAQSLPTGTGMLLSTNYNWVGRPKPGSQYALMVRLGDGTQIAKPINLSYPSGTIQAVLPGIRPDRGPFSAAVFGRYSGDQASSEQLSEFLPLPQ